MKLTFKHPSVAGDMEVSGKLADFFVWLSLNRQDERAVSLLLLLAEHDREKDLEERANIRRTLDEILADTVHEPQARRATEHRRSRGEWPKSSTPLRPTS